MNYEDTITFLKRNHVTITPYINFLIEQTKKYYSPMTKQFIKNNKLVHINRDNISKYMKIRCSGSMRAMLVLIEAIIKLTKTEDERISNDINEFITIIKQFTPDKPVYNATIKFMNIFIVVKTPQEASGNIIDQEIINNEVSTEYAVGIYINENLYDKVPIFVYTYAMFNCNVLPYVEYAEIDSQESIESSTSRSSKTHEFNCDRATNNRNKLLTEFTDGDTLKKIIKNMTIDNFSDLITILFHLLLGLEISYMKCKYQHRDLHCDNLIVKKIRRQLVKYEEKYVLADFIPTLIDYGWSCVTDVNGNKLGITPLELHRGQNLYNSTWTEIKGIIDLEIYDFLKLCFTIYSTLESDNNQMQQYFLNFLNINVEDTYASLVKKMIEKYPNECKWYNDSNKPKNYTTYGNCNNVDTNYFIRKFIEPESDNGMCKGEEWKKLEKWSDETGEKYWYDCGEKSTDKGYDIVTFPKGMSVYHGSLSLVQNNAEFPLGKECYNSNGPEMNRYQENILRNLGNKYKETKDKESITKEINKLTSECVKNSFYGDFETAKHYASLGCPKCISAYKLIHDSKFINMCSVKNLSKIIKSKILNDINTDILLSHYSVCAYGKCIRLTRENLDQLNNCIVMRTSFRKNMYILDNLVNVFVDMGFTGLIFPRTETDDIREPFCNKETGTGYRFAEFIFGKNVLNFLERDFSNEQDWLYQDDSLLTGELGKLVKDFQRYKTLNIYNHQGDLYEHSVWSAFYLQEMFDNFQKEFNINFPNISNEILRKILVLTAFLHDIGKGGDKILMFYDKPNHPLDGSKFFSEQKENYLFEDKSVLNVETLINEEFTGMFPDNIKLLKLMQFIIRNHWDFGEMIKNYTTDGVNVVVKKYIDKIGPIYLNIFPNGNKQDFTEVVKCLMLVSYSDILATKTFTQGIVDNIIRQNRMGILPKGSISPHLKDFPLIINRPTIHRGGSKIYNSYTNEKAINLIKFVIEYIKTLN